MDTFHTIGLALWKNPQRRACFALKFLEASRPIFIKFAKLCRHQTFLALARKDVSNFSAIFDRYHIEMIVSRPGQVWYNKSKS